MGNVEQFITDNGYMLAFSLSAVCAWVVFVVIRHIEKVDGCLTHIRKSGILQKYRD